MPQAGVEVKVFDANDGSLVGLTFTDSDGSYFLTGLNGGTYTLISCIIIDGINYTYTITGIEILPGQVTFKDLYLDEGLCS